MNKTSEKIIMNSLLEESERLHNIIVEWRNGPEPLFDLENNITDWANSLLLAASENEPDQVNLLPGPDPEREREKKTQRLFDPAIIPKLEKKYKNKPDEPSYQKIGSGSSNITRSSKHQKF